MSFVGTLSGELFVSNSSAFIQFAAPLTQTLGSVFYQIVSADDNNPGRVNLSPPTLNNGLSTIAGAYLTSKHRDDPGTGCLLAALGSDVWRQRPAVRRAVADHVRAAVELLTKLIPGKAKAARRQKAISTYATLVGAMVMARAVDNRELSQEILEAARASVKA